MVSKRGEITSEQLISLVLVAVGFIIVLAFFTQLGTKDYTSDQLCKFSVLSRATADEVKTGAGSFLPLQCTTNKICIVAGKDGKCPQFAGEKDVSYVYLPSFADGKDASFTQAANEISRVNAETLYNCWNNMGQGKLDLFNSVPASVGFAPGDKSTCVICTRVVLADDVIDEVIERVNVQQYMKSNTVPGTDKTYLQALSGDDSTNTYSKIEDSNIQTDKTKNIVWSEENGRELAFVFMQFKSSSISEVLQTQLQIGTSATVGSFALAPVKLARFVLTKGSLVYTAVIASAVVGAGALGAYIRQQTAIGYCGEFTTKSSAKQGCSLVQTVNYNVEDIKALCGSLQSNP